MSLEVPTLTADGVAPSVSAPRSVSAFLRSPAEILFGEGMRHSIGWLAARAGTRPFLIVDPHLAGSSSVVEVLDNLSAHGLTTRVWEEVTPELPSDLARRAAREAVRFDADLVIAIGGGSCMDLAKLVATIARHGGQPSDYYGEFAVPGPVLPVIAAPTTAGTGSEVTPVAVVTDAELGTKVGLSSPYLIPHAAVCDPELTHSCPPEVTAASGADALSHCIEAYTARRRPSDPMLARERVFVGRSALTDALALEGLASIVDGLPAAYTDGNDAIARAKTMYGAMLAGMAFGTAGTAAAHALQYPVGARTGTSHGVGVGILLPYVMAYNLPTRVPEMAAIARILGAEGSDQEAHAAPELVSRFLGSVGIPSRLQDIGIAEDQALEIATQGTRAVRLSENNPRTLTVESARDIVTAAIRGDMTSLAASATGPIDQSKGSES